MEKFYVPNHYFNVPTGTIQFSKQLFYIPYR